MPGRWLASVGMVVTWAVWMFGSAVHYTFLPRCLSRSFGSVVQFAILQAALTGVVSWTMRRGRATAKSGKLHKQQQEADDGNGDSLQTNPLTSDKLGGIGAGGNGGGASDPSTAHHHHHNPDGRVNILIAGAAFAVAITMTNASVAYGSVAGSRMVKSLEPAIVAGLQLLAGMDSRADFPWVFLLAFAVSMMLSVAPTGITLLSAAAALLSTAGISTRNVFVKKHMLAVKGMGVVVAGGVATAGDKATGEKTMAAAAATTIETSSASANAPPALDVQTHLNFVACAILIALAPCARVFVAGGGGGGARDTTTLAPTATSDLVIACASFAAFQVAALMVLERVTPTRQAAIKSLQNALTTAWALLIDTTGRGRHNSLEVVPALAWGACVVALASGAQFDARNLRSLAPLGSGRCCWPMSLPTTTLRPWIRTALGGSGRSSLAARKKGEGDAGGGGGEGGGVEVVVLTSTSGTSAAAGAAAVATKKLGGGTGGGGGGAAPTSSSSSASRIAWLVVYCACLAALLLQAALMAISRLSFDAQQARVVEYHWHHTEGGGGGNGGPFVVAPEHLVAAGTAATAAAGGATAGAQLPLLAATDGAIG